MFRIEHFTVAICALVGVQATEFGEPEVQYDAGVCNDTALNVTGKDISGGLGLYYADCDFWAMTVANESNGGQYACCMSSLYDDSDFTAMDMCCACNGNYSWDPKITLNATKWGNLTVDDVLANMGMTLTDYMGLLPSLAEGPCGLMGGTTSMPMGTTPAPPESTATASDPMMSDPATTEEDPATAAPTPAPTAESPSAVDASAAVSRGGALLLHLCMMALSLICVE